MNLAALTKLIKDALVAAGKTTIPVVAPGTTISVLPCVALAPSTDSLGEGNRSLRHGFDVTVIVPRQGQVTQYELLTELEGIVVQSLIPSGIRFEGPIGFASAGGEGTGEPPTMSRIIPISYPSDVVLC
jgi:hypothetical protein